MFELRLEFLDPTRVKSSDEKVQDKDNERVHRIGEIKNQTFRPFNNIIIIIMYVVSHNSPDLINNS